MRRPVPRKAARAAWAALAIAVVPGPARADGPLSLLEAMGRARENAPAVAAARARYDGAAARARSAHGARLGTLDVYEIYQRTDSPAEAFALRLNTRSFSFDGFFASDPNDPGAVRAAITRVEATLPVFTGGELSGRIAQADLSREAAASAARFAADAAAAEAGDAFVALSEAREREGLLSRSLEAVRAHAGLAHAYAAQGLVVRSEALRADVEVARVEDMLAEARGNASVAAARLAASLGEGPLAADRDLEPLPLPRSLDGDAETWLASAPARGDLEAAESLVRAAERQESVGRSAFLPKLAVTARWDLVGTRLFGGSNGSGTIAAVARWNVFSGFADRAALAAARADARLARADLAQRRDGARLGVRRSFETARAARERHATTLRALDAAREGERIVVERFRGGIVKSLDVLDAVTARRDAETRELFARADAHRASLRLALEAGRRPETALEEP